MWHKVMDFLKNKKWWGPGQFWWGPGQFWWGPGQFCHQKGKNSAIFEPFQNALTLGQS